MPTLQSIDASASPEVQMNENFYAVAAAALFGRKDSTTAGLTLGLYGGIIGGIGTFATIADTTVLLTGSATNYVEATTAGVVSANTTAFTAGRQPLYTAVTSASAITTLTDYRVLLPSMSTGSVTYSTLTLATGTITADTPALSITQTWNNAGVNFIAQDTNITNTASGASSMLRRWRVGGAVKASIDYLGAMVLAAGLTAGGSIAANAGLVIAASQALTGTVASSTISGFLSVAATTGTFTNVGGTLTTAAQVNVTSVGTLNGLLVATANHIGLGVTPSAWETTSGSTALQFLGGAVYGYRTTTLTLNQNSYYDGAWKRYGAGYASQIGLDTGAITFYVAGTSTANSAISWTTGLSISNAGAVTIPGTLAVTGAITGASYSGGAISGTTLTTSSSSLIGGGTGGVSVSTDNGVQAIIGGSNNPAANYVRIAASVATAIPVIIAEGSDTDVGLRIAAKGAGTLQLFTGGVFSGGILSSGTSQMDLSSTAGASRIPNGIRIGADSTNNLLDDASNGAGTATLYIGNASINVTSDENLKFNIQPFKRGLDLVKQLQPIEFDQDEMRPFGHIGHYVGFGARAVQKVAPWAVHTQGDTGLPWQARYEFLMAPVVGAVQELAARLEALERRPQ